MLRPFIPAIGLAALLAACGPAAPPPVLSVPPPEAGLDRVMGKDAAMITTLLGDPELDIREGPARKLQYAGALCVLDVYLYPAPTAPEPHATYIEARRPDGGDIDRASCIASLARRMEAR